MAELTPDVSSEAIAFNVLPAMSPTDESGHARGRS